MGSWLLPGHRRARAEITPVLRRLEPAWSLGRDCRADDRSSGCRSASSETLPRAPVASFDHGTGAGIARSFAATVQPASLINVLQAAPGSGGAPLSSENGTTEIARRENVAVQPLTSAHRYSLAATVARTSRAHAHSVPEVRIPTGIRDGPETWWRRGQSEANPAPARIPCLSGKEQGNPAGTVRF
jgi:hypothetical protein